jgi:[acyl-carrier-protein] S-malonyltransferase
VHKIAFLFPGQGAQSVGMLKAAQHLLPVQRMNAVAYKVLGYDLMDLCLNGPEEKLNMTQYSQPAMLLADLAAVEQLLATGQGSVVKQCSAVAGLSLGEWAALVFAGAITFEEAMRCIKVRGKMMADAAVLGDLQGMINVVGLDFAQLTAVCKSVADQYPGSVCQVPPPLSPLFCMPGLQLRGVSSSGFNLNHSSALICCFSHLSDRQPPVSHGILRIWAYFSAGAGAAGCERGWCHQGQ